MFKNLKSLFFSIFFITLLIILEIFPFSELHAFPESKKEVDVMQTRIIKNLKNHPYSGRFMINENLEKLVKETENGDAYQLSLPLLASAQQGDEKTYNKILPKMKKALAHISGNDKNSYKAWLLGRMLLAADVLGEKTVAIKIRMTTILQSKFTKKDEYFAWALGYLASSSPTEYKKYKQEMMNTAYALNNIYENAKENQQTHLSNALWAWVMNLQAAANAKDQETYNKILNEIKKITQTFSISSALTTGLQRTSQSNDYPAWALSIVYRAAKKMEDRPLIFELENSLSNSIQEAKKANANAEMILSELNKALADIEPQMSGKPLLFQFSAT